jgi:hypothetical protein
MLQRKGVPALLVCGRRNLFLERHSNELTPVKFGRMGEMDCDENGTVKWAATGIPFG